MKTEFRKFVLFEISDTSSEVLVSRVVTDLVAGAGLKFSKRGSHELKGLPGRWDLFAARA
jgi:hypothetical protein